MKAYILIAVLLAVPVVARQTAQQPAHPESQAPTQPAVTGHVLSAETHRSSSKFNEGLLAEDFLSVIFLKTCRRSVNLY